MGLPAYQEEFEEFTKTLPQPITASQAAIRPLRDPDDALDDLSRTIHSWWSGMTSRIATYREVVERAETVPAIRFAVDHGVPYLVTVIDRVIELLESGRDPQVDPNDFPPGAPRVAARRYGKRHRDVFDRYLSRAYMLRNAASSIAWDIDPDARGGISFENVDDLIATLK